jgi:hypothetical protein
MPNFIDILFKKVLLIMLIPLTIFFAGLMIPLTNLCQNIEGSSDYPTPMTFIIIIRQHWV